MYNRTFPELYSLEKNFDSQEFGQIEYNSVSNVLMEIYEDNYDTTIDLSQSV